MPEFAPVTIAVWPFRDAMGFYFLAGSPSAAYRLALRLSKLT
jgi:hypothetical protein